jgi:hypothetical protein
VNKGVKFGREKGPKAESLLFKSQIISGRDKKAYQSPPLSRTDLTAPAGFIVTDGLLTLG